MSQPWGKDSIDESDLGKSDGRNRINMKKCWAHMCLPAKIILGRSSLTKIHRQFAAKIYVTGSMSKMCNVKTSQLHQNKCLGTR